MDTVSETTLTVAPPRSSRSRSSRKQTDAAVATAAAVPVTETAVLPRSKSATKARSAAVEPVIVKTVTEVPVAAPALAVATEETIVTKAPRAKRVPKPEPLLIPNPRRFVLFPIMHEDVYKMYKTHLSTEWRTEEVDMSSDIKDWETMTADEKHFISHVLAFFAASDGIVMENLAQRFATEVQWPEARQFYAVQMKIESIHSEAYSLMIDVLIKDLKMRDHIFGAIETIPSIAKKAQWAIKWMEDKEASFAQRLMCFAIVEGIFFSSSFASFFWLKEKGKLKGCTQFNEWISRDEGLHTDFACLLYSYIENRLSKTTVAKIFKEAVAIEKEFITESIPCRLIGMNSDLMCQYIEFVADRLVVQLGYPKIFGATNPFAFMERISVDLKGNFFEVRVTNYANAVNVGVPVADAAAKPKISAKEDF